MRAGAVPDAAGLKPLFASVRVSDYEDLVSGTRHENLLVGYIVCCYGVVVNALRGIPNNERLEIVFEDQDRYRDRARLALGDIAETDSPSLMCTNGKSKLAKWSFVPKGSTSRLELANYFAYAELQISRNKNSVRSKWCHRILETNNGDCLGARMDKSLAREIITSMKRMSA